MKEMILVIILIFLLNQRSWCTIQTISVYERRPNIVIIVADDLGIGDVGCYGNTTVKTPNIDRLAKEGVLLEHHLAAAALCTPSRAALLTGRYPSRFGLSGDFDTPAVIVHVASKASLPHSEITLAEALTEAGYVTGAVGKWHLGSGCNLFGRNCTVAQDHGFSHFYGIPFTLSAEMEGDHPFWIFDLKATFYQAFLSTVVLSVVFIAYCSKKGFWKLTLVTVVIGVLFYPTCWFLCTHYRFYTARWWQVSSWMDQNLNGIIIRNGKPVYQTPPFDVLTEEFVSESVQFISNHSHGPRPFFLFHSFTHVHVPMFTAKENENRSACGRYCDNIEEMDDAIGDILQALKDENIENNTIVYFVSDHGGHLESVDPADGQRIGGYNKLFKGGKGMGMAEGGIRVPGIFRWPGVIPAGSRLHDPTSLLDILPTMLELAGLPEVHELIPEAMTLDGISFAPKLKAPPKNPQYEKRILIHHCRGAIQGLRLVTSTKIYKMYLFLLPWKENSTQCGWGVNVMCPCYGKDIIDVSESPRLYELTSDPYEDYPVDEHTEEYKEVVAELRNFLDDWKSSVYYPPSMLKSPYDVMLLPWLQPSLYF